jgi:hypothetical protein
MEAVKVMIHVQDTPMHLWKEESNTTVYMQKKSPHKLLENKTPKEIFLGENMEVSHLRIFGCLVFVHVPKEKRKKLDPSRRTKYFLVSVTHRRHTGYIFSVTRKLRLIEMSPSMRVHLSANQNRTMQKRFMRRRMKLLEL